jgi:carboxyl-terminal processing protease
MAACAAPAPVRSTSLASTPVTDPLVTFDSAWAIIARSHWDTTYNGVNWGALRDSLRPKAAAAKTTGELRGVLSAMVGSLRQSHFSIIPREVSDPATTAATSAGSRAATAGSADPSGVIGATLRYVDERIVIVSGAAVPPLRPVSTGLVLESVQGCPSSTGPFPRPDARHGAAALTAHGVGRPRQRTVAATF